MRIVALGIFARPGEEVFQPPSLTTPGIALHDDFLLVFSDKFLYSGRVLSYGSKMLRKFLGTDRVLSLFDALRLQSGESLSASPRMLIIGFLTFAVYAGILIGGGGSISRGDTQIILVLSLVGIFLWARYRSGFQAIHYRGLSHIHTAFALGVIPAIGVLFLAPEGLGSNWSGEPTAVVQTRGEVFLGILLISLFAGITEEIFFRGVLVSTLRRVFPRGAFREVVSILFPAIIFGAFHGIHQGFAAGVALTGVGIGLGMGYVASKESLGGVALYHVAFDLLSLSLPLLSGLSR